MPLLAAWRSTIGSSSEQESFFEYLEEDHLWPVRSGRCRPKEGKVLVVVMMMMIIIMMMIFIEEFLLQRDRKIARTVKKLKKAHLIQKYKMRKKKLVSQ